MIRLRVAPFLALFACASAFTQSLSILVKEGDSVPGVGLVTGIDGVEVGSASNLFVEVDTDHPDTDADSVLLRNSAVFLREGQALSVAGGATLGSFDGLSISSLGAPALNLFLDGTGSTSTNSGLFIGDALVIQEGEVSTASGFAPGTAYTGFFDVQFGTSGTFYVMASVDDPTVPSSTDRALVGITVDEFGGLLGEQVSLKEGDIPAGQTEPIADFETGAEEYAINALGLTMLTVDLAGDTSVDRAVYLGPNLLMQEGSPSPVPGRNWGSLASVELDLNDGGRWVAKANLDSTDLATDQVIIRDGAVFMREGASLPDIAPFTLEDFGGSVGVFILPNGDVLWFGDWNNPDTTRDEGLFLNDRLILQEGVTVIDGHRVVDLADFTESLHVAADGQLALMEGEIESSGAELDAAILVYLGAPTAYCSANPNSTGLPALHEVLGGTSVAANNTALAISQMPPFSFGYFLTSRTQGFTVLAGGSEGNLCLGGDIGRYVGPGQIQQSNGLGTVSLRIDLTLTPQPTGLVAVQAGEQWNFQGWYRDSNGGSVTSNFTNGVTVVFSP